MRNGFWDVLVELHAVDPAAAGLAALGKGDGLRRAAGVRLDHPLRQRPYRRHGRLVRRHRLARRPSSPPTWAHCLIHNDFRLDNVVLSPDDPVRIVGVLDWEMATVGDPLMDLGGTLAYWVQEDDDEFFRQFRRQPTNAPGMWTRAEVVDYYCERTGRSVTPEQWRFYEVFGLFRLAVIAQQIWYRYYHGQTTNEAYAVFGPAVGYLEQRCRAVIGD